MKTYYYQGGLGDFFCYLYSPLFANHSIRSAISEALAEHDSLFHIYSDNPDSFSLFARLGLLYIPHRFDEYPFDSVDPHLHPPQGVLIHPFTSTPTKLWNGVKDGTLKKMIDFLIDNCGEEVFLWGKDNPSLYFGGDKPFNLYERFDYHRDGLHNYTVCQSNNVYTLLALIQKCKRMICIDSAAMMARHLNKDMKIFSLFPPQYKNNTDLFSHYYYKGLDLQPNKYVYYDGVVIESMSRWMKE